MAGEDAARRAATVAAGRALRRRRHRGRAAHARGGAAAGARHPAGSRRAARAARRSRRRGPRRRADRRALGRLALGRGQLALGDLVAAGDSLDRAWAAGNHAPEVAAALAAVWERRWERDKDEASREGSAERDQQSEQSTRARVAEWLKLARGTAALDGELLEAKLDYVEDRAAAARDRAKQAYARDPLLYEALLLEGRASSKLGHKAAGRGKLAEARAQYADAERALVAAAGIARSDPDTQFQLCRLYDRILKLPSSGATPRDEVAIVACRQAALVDPSSDAAQGKLAIALNRVAEQRREGAGELLAQAQAAAERAVALAPRFANHYRVLANTHRLRREYDAALATVERGLHADPDARSAQKLLITAAQIEMARARDLLAQHRPADAAVAASFAAIERARGYADDFRVQLALTQARVLAAVADPQHAARLVGAARAELAKTLQATGEETPALRALAAELTALSAAR